VELDRQPDVFETGAGLFGRFLHHADLFDVDVG
jgi:hypothetical protein